MVIVLVRFGLPSGHLWLTTCSLCILTICDFTDDDYFQFEGWIWVLFACMLPVAKQYMRVLRKKNLSLVISNQIDVIS